MKKVTIIIAILTLVLFASTEIVTAQNLALNPGYENWTVNGAGGPADNWSLSGTSMTGAQETTTVRTGTYSTNITWTTTSTRYLEQSIAVTAGSNYSFSFWALDNDPAGRARVYLRWYDSGGGFVSAVDNGYTADDPNWQQLTTGSITAPAGAAEAHIEIRVYDVSAGWSGTATIYVDDVEFVAVTSVEMSNAYAISETEIDVLYSAAITSINPADYSLTGTANITFSGASIDGSNSNLVHLTGASVNMASDITLDNIADAANSDNFDFYAGIMANAFVNTTNPGGTMSDGEIATFKGVVSANDAFNNVWFSDGAGAYNGVLIYSSSFDGLVAVGDEILITAKRTTYDDLSELESPELLSIISNGNTPYGPDVIDGSDIDQSNPTNTNPAESWEGQFVKIENFTVDSYVDYDYTCSWSDGSNTYYFHIGDNVDYHFGSVSLNVGETYSSISGVVDWYNSGPYYRINPREQSDIIPGAATARIVGTMQGWNTTDPDYIMNTNANGLYELTKSLDAGDHEYKVIEGDAWTDPNYPGNNQHVILTGTENVTWKANITAELVTHTLPVVAGDFLTAIGGTNWEPTELMGEMSDPDGDDIFTLELTIPAGSYEGKVTLNNNWDQSTGGNIPFTTDGVNATTFTYDFPNNTTTISGPPPPAATFTFIVEDIANMNYDGFFLKGSWDVNGQFDPSWGGGAEHSAFYDDGTHGDVTADDNIWTTQMDLVVDGGSNTWEWGVNDSEHNWVAGNWQFSIPDQTAQTQIWLVPDVVDLVINEIMYNSPGADEEWIELYNNTDQTIDLENWRFCDNDASHTNIVIPAGYSIVPEEYFTISIATNGLFPFTPDYDGTGNFSLNNGGDAVRAWNPDGLLVDIVVYDDSSPWPSDPDGNGPTLSLIEPILDNSLPTSWDASIEDGGTPGALNFPPVPFTSVITPNGGEFITQGDQFDITWSYGFWTGAVEIFLVKQGVDPELLVSNISIEDLSWTWTVMATQELGDDYKILIDPIDSANPSDESDDYFSIIEEYFIPELVITEIMYNPPESGNDSLEFIEIYNNGTETVNLEGFSFTEGVEYVFPSVDLLPDNYLLVSIDSLAMMGTLGVDAYQWTGGALSNGGEKIELSDNYANVVDSLTYDDYLPWDTLADGYGPSLTLCNPDTDNSIAENWTHSVNLVAINTAGDSIWATPGFSCQVELLSGFEADVTYLSIGGEVNFTDLTVGDPIEWVWTFEGGTPATYNGQTPPAIVYDEVGTWDVTLYVSDGVNNDEITYTDYIETVDFPAPTNLVAVVGSFDDVQLAWNEPVIGKEVETVSYNNKSSISVAEVAYSGRSTDAELLGYNVYRDDLQINTAIVEVTEYNDAEPTIGSHDYYVKAVYEGGESEPSNVVTIVVTDVNELLANSVVVYPNPTTGVFTIEFSADTKAEVEIIDITGKEVYSKTLSNSTSINISGVHKGIYFVRIVDVKTGYQHIQKLIIK
jgi:lamin tail-like protein/type IX secretion system substrate protein/pullulanase-like protein/PKD domain-containing protein/rhamnogalacturonan lyase-like protein